MYKVVTKRFLNEAKTICLFEIEAPLAAKHAQAGQFVIFRLDEQGERVPVSIAGWDREKGTVTVMVQAAGRTTRMLHTVEQGDYITDFVGPLGKATEMEGLKKVCGETKFACVDGPDFDAHEVDFDSLLKRAAFYKEEQDEEAKHICRMTGGHRNG